MSNNIRISNTSMRKSKNRTSKKEFAYSENITSTNRKIKKEIIKLMYLVQTAPNQKNCFNSK